MTGEGTANCCGPLAAGIAPGGASSETSTELSRHQPRIELESVSTDLPDDIDVSVDVRFAMIPYWVLLHEGISPTALRLYGVIRKHADNETGLARPSRKTLANLCRITTRTVDRLLPELEAAGAIEVRARWMNAAKTSFRSAPDGEHMLRAPSHYVVKSFPPKQMGGGDIHVSTPPVTSEGGVDTDVSRGRDMDVSGVGTQMSQELDPQELDPEELDKEGGCVSGVRHLPPAAPVDNSSSLPAESVDAATKPAPEPGEAPNPWCAEHPGGTTDSCAQCGVERRKRNRWEAETAKARAAQRRDEITERHQAEADEIAACGMCDAEGWVPGERAVKCLHDPHAIETARRGAERVRAALAAKSRTRDTDPRPDRSGPATACTAPKATTVGASR